MVNGLMQINLKMRLWMKFKPCLMTAPSPIHVTGQSMIIKDLVTLNFMNMNLSLFSMPPMFAATHDPWISGGRHDLNQSISCQHHNNEAPGFAC